MVGAGDEGAGGGGGPNLAGNAVPASGQPPGAGKRAKLGGMGKIERRENDAASVRKRSITSIYASDFLSATQLKRLLHMQRPTLLDRFAASQRSREHRGLR